MSTDRMDSKPGYISQVEILLGGKGNKGRKVGRLDVGDTGSVVDQIIAEQRDRQAFEQINELKVAEMKKAVAMEQEQANEATTKALKSQANTLAAKREVIEEGQKLKAVEQSQAPPGGQAYGYQAPPQQQRPSMMNPEMLKTLADMPEDKRAAANAILQQWEMVRSGGDNAVMNMMMAQTLQQMAKPTVSSETIRQVNPMEMLTQAIEIIGRLQAMTAKEPAPAAAPSMVDNLLREKLAEFISAKIGESLGIGPQTPTVVDLNSGQETTMVMDQNTGDYFPLKVDKDTWEKIQDRRDRLRREEKEERKEHDRWNSVEKYFLKPLGKTTLPQIGDLAKKAISGGGRKGGRVPAQGYQSPPTFPKQGAFQCSKCGNTVVYPIPPPSDYVAVCQNCGMEFFLKEKGQEQQQQQQQQAQQQQRTLPPLPPQPHQLVTGKPQVKAQQPPPPAPTPEVPPLPAPEYPGQETGEEAGETAVTDSEEEGQQQQQ